MLIDRKRASEEMERLGLDALIRGLEQYKDHKAEHVRNLAQKVVEFTKPLISPDSQPASIPAIETEKAKMLASLVELAGSDADPVSLCDILKNYKWNIAEVTKMMLDVPEQLGA